MFDPDLLSRIRARFAHVEEDPFTGPRVFLESAGGALHLNQVVETSAKFAALPDNQGRANAVSRAFDDIIARARDAFRLFLNVDGGEVLVGESGTELLHRLIRTAMVARPDGQVIGTTLEHPASRDAMAHWARVQGREHILVPHDDSTGTVWPEAYRAHLTPDVAVATVIHTSPVTGRPTDLPGIVRQIRAAAPEAIIIVDGIQHASHGAVDLAAAPVDGYVISPYKVFSRHGYGLAWASNRLKSLDHEGIGGKWEHGTRDTGAYATWLDVMAYLDWLGGEVSDAAEPRARLEAAAHAIHLHETALAATMIEGTDNLAGIRDLPGVTLIGGDKVEPREGVVSFTVGGRSSAEIVAALEEQGLRAHTRKADAYSGNVLSPLGFADCVRISTGHYNSPEEIRRLLGALAGILGH